MKTTALRTIHTAWHWTLLAAVTLTLSACGGASDSVVVPTPTPAPVVTNVGVIDGQVINAASGAPVAGVVVTVGNASATTGADGRYQLPSLPANARTVLTLRATGFAAGLSVADVAAADSAFVSTRLLPVGIATTLANATGGDVTLSGSTARVSLPANAFGAATGNITVALTAVNPGQDASAMPGDYTTGSGSGRLESFGALLISATDAAGAPVNLAAGRSAVIRIPVASRGAVQPTMGLFALDTVTGSWVREGTATLQGTGALQFYEGTVTRLAAWNADQALDTVNVSGCVVDAAGARVAGVNIASDGINYSGISVARTGVDGSFTVAVKRGALASITGSRSGGLLTNTARTGPNAANASLGTCLALTAASNAVTMRLTWGALPTDVDSYLFTPSGARINYASTGNLSAAPFANLDVDDTTSFGPEVVTINRLMVGTYSYGLDNYSTDRNPALTGSPVRVELNVGGRVQVFGPPPGETVSTNYLRLFTLTVDARCNVTVTPVNVWEASVPTAGVDAAPTYCTP